MSIDKASFMMTPAANGNYYHWMADLLPRLLLVMRCNLADFDQRQIILHHPSRRYEQETFRLLGIAEERLIRLRSFETLSVKDLVHSDFLHSRDGQSFPFWKRELLDSFKHKVLGSIPRRRNRKIYLLRGKQRTRRLIGEERLVFLLKELGFEVVDPQQKSLLEQMQTLAEAQVVVAVHGAALTNIIFCQEGTRVIELRSSFKPPEHYSEIAKTYKLQFETISLAPARLVRKPHLALQQNLFLTSKSLEALLSVLKVCEARPKSIKNVVN